VEAYYHDRVAPVERILQPFHPDPEFVRSIAFALVDEGQHVGMDPRALASLLLVENPRLDRGATSFVGAVGLMQVMPFHAGRWGCASADLTDVRANICHGARIFADYLRRHRGDVDRALLAYNGCVRGENTPDCGRYPFQVYSNAGRLAMQAWLSTP
jgi:soluble lytic murein transglycosylase-like protein